MNDEQLTQVNTELPTSIKRTQIIRAAEELGLNPNEIRKTTIRAHEVEVERFLFWEAPDGVPARKLTPDESGYHAETITIPVEDDR